MSFTDPVADFLTRLRNSIRARHQKLDVPASKLKTEIARILKEEGYIANYKAAEENGRNVLRVNCFQYRTGTIDFLHLVLFVDCSDAERVGSRPRAE